MLGEGQPTVEKIRKPQLPGQLEIRPRNQLIQSFRGNIIDTHRTHKKEQPPWPKTNAQV